MPHGLGSRGRRPAVRPRPSRCRGDPLSSLNARPPPPPSDAMLYFVGLGLGDEKDITLRGLEAVKRCSHVYLESYTSLLGVDKAALERLYERPVQVAEREFVEERAEEMLDLAAPPDAHVAFLVVGDPYGATTHTDLWLRAVERGIPVEVVHNASIMNAVAACGLQLYRFGEAVSLCFWTDTWKPDSYWAKIARNRSAGLHTLCLLDIKVREPSVESLARGRRVYEPPRFMSVAQAAAQLLDIVAGRGGSGGVADTAGVGPDTRCVGLARVGQANQVVVYGRLADLADADVGPPLHSLVVPAADLHFHEQAVVDHYALEAAPTQAAGDEEPPAAAAKEE
ncbi:hypothetical protein MMPV_003051 [Pyropia vietnamensis]